MLKVTSGLNKNVISIANLIKTGVLVVFDEIGVLCVLVALVLHTVLVPPVSLDVMHVCFMSFMLLFHGWFRNLFALAEQHHIANKNWSAANKTIPASFEFVKYLETAVTDP